MVKTLDELIREFQTEYPTAANTAEPTEFPMVSRDSFAFPNALFPEVSIPAPDRTSAARTVLRRVLDTLFCAVISLLLLSLLAGGVSSVFGHLYFSVRTQDIPGDFSRGALAVFKKADPSQVKIGEIIAVRDGAQDFLILQILSIENYQSTSGERRFEARKADKDTTEPLLLQDSDLAGCYWFSIPKLGGFFDMIQNHLGIFILILFLLLLAQFFLRLGGKKRRKIQ